MEAAFLYLMKANGVLALFAVAYYGLLRRLTFFGLNRAYLLLALLFAAVYPTLPVPGLLPAEVGPAHLPVVWIMAGPVVSPTASLPATSGISWLAVCLSLYAIGTVLLLGRLLVQLLALARLHRRAVPATTAAGVPYRRLPVPGEPFSFGHTIYLYPSQHTAAELAVVVAHEQAHVHQAHTVDVLLAHLGTAFFWLNPAAWLLRRALLDNLEFLADAATLRTGLDRRAYQYCLLQLSQGLAGPALALPFTFFTLKNRVAMMNTPLSSTGQLVRYLLAGPLVAVAALGYAAAHTHRAAPVGSPAWLLPNKLVATPAPDDARKTSESLTPGPVDADAALPAAVLSQQAPAAAPKLEASPTQTRQAGPSPLYYIDGKLATEAAAKALNATAIANMQVLLGEKAIQLIGGQGANGVVVITTKAGQNLPAAVALNQRVSQLAPMPVAQANGSAISRGLAASKSLPDDVPYYLDGQPSTKAAVSNLNPDDIFSVNVVKDKVNIVQDKPDHAQSPGLSNQPAQRGIFITTKAHNATASTHVRQPAEAAADYAVRSVGVYYLLPATLAYITSHYPDSRLGEVNEMTHKTTGAVKLQVQLITGRRPFYVYFSPQGGFLGE
ncbi:MAG: M56 family metallopeptidase [Janthinobacterium lividum]